MASDSSTSTTPLILTPESTGTSPEPSSSSSSAKKARRQTAFYPNVNSSNKQQKPFSRSAAKRESVMALGSIEHLQYYFTKTGIAAKKSSKNKQLKGLVPAIGGQEHIRTTSNQSLSGITLPPTPAFPEPHSQAFPSFVKTFDTDPDSLLPGVVEDLNSVSHAWQIGDSAASLGASQFDVLHVLKLTTTAVRAVRNYVVSLPDESAGTIRAQFRSKALSPGGVRSKAAASSDSDPITLIRRSALDVLTALRALEESSRLPLSDDAYDAQSDGRHSRNGMASPSSGSSDLPVSEDGHPHVHEVDADAAVSFSLVKVQGRYESVPVWEDDTEDQEAEEEHKEGWDEKLVVGNGWLYRQDIKSAELEKERQIVASYLDVVDEVLFEGKRGGRRGWNEKVRKLEKGNRRRVSAGDAERRNLGLLLAANTDRRVSTGMLDTQITEEPDDMEEHAETEESTDDEDLPIWAKRQAFPQDDLGRAHSLIFSLLPSYLRDSLAPASPRDAFLDSLSSGQLLCVAYNGGVRKSKKPWGYVNQDGIHDIIALEKTSDSETRKKGWTFRRTDNLRLWIGALKLRYMLPIVVPYVPQGASPASSPGATQTRFPAIDEPPLHFDAKVVARKDDGWEDMLEGVLLRWTQKVVDEHNRGGQL